jgi:outer membrane protein assembly factor BamB
MSSDLRKSLIMNIFGWSSKGISERRKSWMTSYSFSLNDRKVSLAIILIFILIFSCKKKDIQIKDSMPRQWVTLLPSVIYYSSPVLSADEKTVYIGTSSWLSGTHRTGQVFVAMDAATGKDRWRIQLGANEVRSTPAIASDKSIYFTVEIRDPVNSTVMGDELWHISANGDLLWKYNINPGRLTIEVGQSTPAIGPDGTIYAAGDKLYAINPDGSLRWATFGTSIDAEALRNAPVIGKDGTVYFVYHNIPLTALNPADGSVIWTCTLGVNDHCFASPAIGADGIIYVATQPGLLYAVSPNGQPVWTFDLASVGFTGTFRSSPAIDDKGSVYFGINTGNPSSAFFALNPDGTLKWKYEPADLPDDVPKDHFDIYSSPAIGSDGVVYFGQEFGRVYGLRKSDGSLIGMVNTESGITWSSPAIDHKGVLYISDISGRVYALQTGSKGLDTLAAWPKFRYDNQNTGRLH